MSNINQYLSAARSRASQRWSNASGNQIGTGGSAYGALANKPGQSGMANGFSAAGSSPAAAVSPTYIIQVSNSSAVTYSSGFDVLGAFQYLMGSAGTWSNGSFTLNGITISSVFSTVTYQQILFASQSQPFQVGAVYLQGAGTGAANQVSDVYTLTTQSTAGETYSRPIKPYINPNQFQNTITYNNSAFVVNGYTKLTWSNIYGGSSFQISFFPAAVIDPAQALNGSSVQSNFVAPNVATNTVTLR